jgi:hypothetical protein
LHSVAEELHRAHRHEDAILAAVGMGAFVGQQGMSSGIAIAASSTIA